MLIANNQVREVNLVRATMVMVKLYFEKLGKAFFKSKKSETNKIHREMNGMIAESTCSSLLSPFQAKRRINFFKTQNKTCPTT